MPSKQGTREQATPPSKDRSSGAPAGSKGARTLHFDAFAVRATEAQR